MISRSPDLPLAVIGGGPAGLSAALAAAETGVKVRIFEYLPDPGRKLLASGAGKCNFTNILDAGAMAERFAPEMRRFVLPSFRAFPPEALRKFFRDHGIPLKTVDDFYYFPASEKAGDLLDVLLRELKHRKTEILCHTPVTGWIIQNGRIAAVTTADGREFPCCGAVLAGGGKGYPALGGRGSAYLLAEKAGHTVVPPVPALVGLTLAGNWGVFAGTVLPRVRLTLDRKNGSEGELLFTHEGISAPAALDLSGRVCRRGFPAELKICWDAQKNAEFWRVEFDRLRRENGRKKIFLFLGGFFPRALAERFCGVAETGDASACSLSACVRDRLIGILADCAVTVTGSGPWEKAMATSGGVARTEIFSKNMMSRRIPNLAFAGEVVDVDGPCGGYNMQWAFSSGRVAGQSIARNIRQNDAAMELDGI